jgi:LemA protein
MAESFFQRHKKIIICLIIVLIIIGFIVSIYNNFVVLDQDINGKWSEVENQYQRQFDLIPNLVSLVSSYKIYESGLLQNLTDLRTRWAATATQVNKDQVGQELQTGLSRLIAVAENYPTLKADTQYTNLKDELTGAQNRISTARTRYISSIQNFNTAIRLFPGNVFAGLFGFSGKDYYMAQEGAMETPVVNV